MAELGTRLTIDLGSDQSKGRLEDSAGEANVYEHVITDQYSSNLQPGKRKNSLLPLQGLLAVDMGAEEVKTLKAEISRSQSNANSGLSMRMGHVITAATKNL